MFNIRNGVLVRGFNPGPTLTRPPSYYTPTGRRDGEGDDRIPAVACAGACARKRPLLQAEELPWPSPGGDPGENRVGASGPVTVLRAAGGR